MSAAPLLGRRDVVWALVVFVLGALALLPGVFFEMPTGKAVEGGLRVHAGQVPYRDFWTMYAPGHFYVMAALFGVFGREVLVQGIAVALVRAAGAAAFFALLRRTGASRALSLVFAALVAGMGWTTGAELTSYPPALLLILMSLGDVVAYLHGCGARRLVRAGAWIGLAACFKHDVAFYVATGTIACLILTAWRAGAARPEGWLPPFAAALRFGVPALLALLPLAVFLAWNAGPDVWQDLVVFPATTFSMVRNNDYPSLWPPVESVQRWLADTGNPGRASAAGYAMSEWLLANAPQLVFVAAVVVLVRHRSRIERVPFALAVLGLCCLPPFWLASHVQMNTHIYSMAVLSLFLLSLGWRGAGRRTRIALGVVVAGIAAGLALPPAMKAARMASEWADVRTLPRTVIGDIRLSRGERNPYAAVAAFFRRNTDDEERIYAGLFRHDAIVINDPLLYAVANRASCCRHSELHPGVADRESVQREIIADIERHAVRGVVLWKFGWSDKAMRPFRDRAAAANPDGASTVLDRYLREHFEVVAWYGEYVLMWTKREEAPPPPWGKKKD